MLAAMPDVFGDDFEMPSIYGVLTRIMGLCGLNLDKFMPIRCLFHNISNPNYFFLRLVVVELFPFAAIALLWCLGLVLPYLRRRLYGDGSLGVDFEHDSRRFAFQLAIFFSYLALPTCAFSAISSLVCDSYDHGSENSESFLRAARDINCDGAKYTNRILPFGCFSVVLVGLILVLFSSLLLKYKYDLRDAPKEYWDDVLRQRTTLWSDLSPAEIEYLKASKLHQVLAAESRARRLGAQHDAFTFQFLWSGYRVDCYGWECLELVRRLFLTAIISVCWPGSRLQMALALSVSMFYILLYNCFHPFIYLGDEIVSTVTNWTLAVSYLVSLMVNARIGVSKKSPSAKVLLVGSACMPILAVLYCLPLRKMPKEIRVMLKGLSDFLRKVFEKVQQALAYFILYYLI